MPKGASETIATQASKATADVSSLIPSGLFISYVWELVQIYFTIAKITQIFHRQSELILIFLFSFETHYL